MENVILLGLNCRKVPTGIHLILLKYGIKIWQDGEIYNFQEIDANHFQTIPMIK